MTPRAERAWRVALLALLTGALHALSFGPFDAWWLQSLSMAAMLLLWLTRPDGGWQRGALIGGAFGLGWFVCGLYWLYISMHHFGGMPAPLAALAVLLLAAYLSLFPALLLALISRLRAPPLACALLLAGGWLLAEWLRGVLFTGFPWLAIGYAHVDGPLAGFAAVLGLPGVNAMAALLASGLALMARHAWIARTQRTRLPWGTLIASVALPLALGQGLRSVEWTEAIGNPMQVRLTQGNVPQSMKFDARHTVQAMRSYVALIDQPSAGPPPDLIVLPETAWTIPWPGTPPEIVTALFPPGQVRHGVLAIGMPMPPSESSLSAARAKGLDALRVDIANSVLVFDRAGNGQARAQYDKHHLLPFGEFVPIGFQWFVRLMQIPLGSFTRGPIEQPPIPIAGQQVAFNICYEDLFGEELLASIRQGASVLINVSNLGWFGDSIALPQHLAIARMRAIETGRPMLRSTNTGVTASIDSRGHVRAQLKTDSIGSLDDSVQGTRGLTPYVRWGNTLPLTLALVLVLIATAFALHSPPRSAAIR